MILVEMKKNRDREGLVVKITIIEALQSTVPSKDSDSELEIDAELDESDEEIVDAVIDELEKNGGDFDATLNEVETKW